MKAMILAAGLGTRLRPLTDTRPKALVELAGRTLLDITLARLRAFGITEVIVNVHHFADQVIDYLKSNKNFGMRIEISREDDLLLDTGGGLKKAAWFFLEDSATRDPKRASTIPGSSTPARSNHLDEPFLLHNVDVISNIDLRAMLQFHKDHHALATLAVQSRPSSRQLLFNNQLHLCARARSTVTPDCAPQMTALPNPSGTPAPPIEAAKDCHSERSEESAFSESQAPSSESLHPLAFSGIHLISPRLLPLLTEDGIFSIVDSYLRLAAQGQPILAFPADNYYWRDLGRPSDLTQAALDLREKSL
jgi:NDP-sugar pyrophosphorylase family protein